ncbi:MAG: hypothetical protein LBF75_01975 [Treponema sp.]|jgi:hypothetical protein|nr:hypothetical protein [Treponema sp.]
MLYAPQMILIGSAGQNAGKTTLAKALIKTWKSFPPGSPAHAPIVALKITSVAQQGALCPRGGTGCGACVSITQDFVLEEEQGTSPNKDTAQLLKAGADRVFWLRSLYGSMAAAYTHFLDQIPPKGLIICESNSLREVVLPGCFIMLMNTAGTAVKPTAARVLPLADLVIQNKGLPEDLNSVISRIQVIRDDTRGIQVHLRGE